MFSFTDVEKAADRIRGQVRETPLVRIEALDEYAGCQVYAKLENLQVTGSFKYRGAANTAMLLSPDQLTCGLVAASSGNHGKALSYIAKALGTQATIVIPDSAPQIKVDAISALGTNVVRCSVEERFEKAAAIADETGATLVPPYDDYRVMAGQGTLGIEICKQLPDVSAVIAPVSGGGLLGGVATAVKEMSPEVRVCGAEPAARPRWTQSIAADKRVTVAAKATLADALVTLTPGTLTYPVVRQHVDSIAAVEEKPLVDAFNALLGHGKILAEYSSCIGLAAAHENLLPIDKDDKVCFVISGGSISLDQVVK